MNKAYPSSDGSVPGPDQSIKYGMDMTIANGFVKQHEGLLKLICRFFLLLVPESLEDEQRSSTPGCGLRAPADAMLSAGSCLATS